MPEQSITTDLVAQAARMTAERASFSKAEHIHEAFAQAVADVKADNATILVVLAEIHASMSRKENDATASLSLEVVRFLTLAAVELARKPETEH